jgi:uncharacterized radical SAM superfamily Fe-S cluster-containing enzyme
MNIIERYLNKKPYGNISIIIKNIFIKESYTDAFYLQHKDITDLVVFVNNRCLMPYEYDITDSSRLVLHPYVPIGATIETLYIKK